MSVDEEILLPIYRDYTDKEKIAWLEQRIKIVCNENRQLKKDVVSKDKKIKKLKEKIERDDPHLARMNGESQVSAKAFLKLRIRYKELDERYWELLKQVKSDQY